MARTKEFDPDAALWAALELFWERGYEGTSMSDLVERLGVGRASIYATFGNKRELYLKALARYEEGLLPDLLADLSAPGAALPGVRALVRRYAAETTAGELRLRGCFVTNTAAELAPHDPVAARRVERNWDQLETVLHTALARAGAQGELPAGRDPRALARMLMVLLQGMRVVGKASADPARIRDAAEQALALLD
ncbi:TetR/AcrR family transcriptional regulator [Streptomyces parvulus]|uniref:TetR family transcriptional regulator n=1 Tax=Streptomyces parvulus TaxID=146923 RepID=A0A191UXK3_9ACTN|nr:MULTISPECIES: TetR/AcrR family transcriptional regulator [Streptomyces]MZD56717.1 TetR family transcriptional regulator [Streptomyces sp. SID5606]ANJ07395.1 TetR family transcriptional regulator [Streptomyces parvulus]MCC9152351.1 TetR/AcrR family transcriptional regulator; helix-turn-helix transcriptional regulator [Streptomyces parvulus]MCE7685670.1 TetR/AcrR family transcriptional regulator [Streptomyces parvulus]WML80279.1 TetR/AcrR family transcriptional regulator [Streptomyces sp. VNU